MNEGPCVGYYDLVKDSSASPKSMVNLSDIRSIESLRTAVSPKVSVTKKLIEEEPEKPHHV